MWAVISAIAAGATSVFAKAGLDDVPSNLGNEVRTAIVLVLALGVLVASGEHSSISMVSGRVTATGFSQKTGTFAASAERSVGACPCVDVVMTSASTRDSRSSRSGENS